MLKCGLDLLQQLRAEQHDLPVLVLTARDGTAERIAGLDAGADDYLVKPFDVEELKARARALLRRSQGRAQPMLEHGVRLDPATQQVRYQDADVIVTPMEYQLLHQLMVRPGKVVTRERLSRALYGTNALNFSPPGSEVAVVVRKDEAGRVCLRVEDAGPGIDEGEIGRLFERFYSRGNANGAGLGLAIVQMVTNKIGCTLRLYNLAGGGVCAELCLNRDLASPTSNV